MGEGLNAPPTWGAGAHQAPGHLSCLDLGRAQNAGPTESVPLCNTQEPEPEWLRSGKSTQPRACLRRFPCRATWKLSNVDWESTPAMSWGKPSMAETLRALPTHASDICLQWSSLPTARLNAAKSLQSCPTLRPHRRQPTRLPHPLDSPGKTTGVSCHFLLQCTKVKSESEAAQLCPTLSDPMDCSPPGSSVHGIFQAIVLQWGAIAFSGM